MKVSIIIPIYNAQLYVCTCLENITNQTYRNIEIIVVNDGSTDRSLEIAQQYQSKDDRIKIISQTNKGASAARQAGIECANGDYLYFQDVDDLSSLDAIDLLVTQATQTNADIIIGDYEHDSLYTKSKIQCVTPIEGVVSGGDYMSLILQGKSFTSLCMKLIRKNLFNTVENLPLKIGEDTVVLMQLAYKAVVVAKVDKIVYTYIMRQGSATYKPNDDTLNDYLSSLIWVHNFIKMNKIDPLYDVLHQYLTYEYAGYLLNNGRIANYLPVQSIVFHNYKKHLSSIPLKNRLVLRCYIISPLIGCFVRSSLNALIKVKRYLIRVIKK